ncbi:MAG: hypothetical protein M1830_009056 [Pleopsidium flavum]|nr:MAG: hypothetical protein M1830_009056 [Pleopsidium flavum]
MSKRSADVQGSREGWFEGDGTNPRGPMDTPKRATAAQMANRKTGRRPVASSPAPAFSSNNSLANQQPSQGPFSNIDPNILNSNATINSHQQQQQSGTPVGQQNGQPGALIFGASQSFPPDTSSSQSTNLSASFGGFGNASNIGSSISAPSSSEFNFAPAATVNNPFTSTNAPIINQRTYSGTWNSVGGTSQGYKGALFSVAAERDSVPQFAPQPSEPSSSPFGQAAQGTQSQPASTIFAKSSTTSQQPQTNTDVFGQSSSQQSQQSATPINIFGRSSVSTLQSPQSSNLFWQSDDKMQTSPDNTPEKVDVPKPGHFAFLSQAQKSPTTEAITASVEGNLFAKPLSTPAPAFTGTTASSGNNLYSGVSQPAPAVQQTSNSSSLIPGLQMPPTTTSPLGPKERSTSTLSDIFSGVSNPSNSALSPSMEQPAQANGSLVKPSRPIATPGSSKSAPLAGNPFANIKMPPVSQAASGTPGAKQAQSDSTTGFQIKGSAALLSPATSLQKPTAPFTAPSVSQPFIAYDTLMGMPPPAPSHFTKVQQQQYVTGYRIRSLNQGFQKHVVSMTGLKDIDIAVRFYTEKREQINAAGGLPTEGLTGSKRKSSGDEATGERSHLNKKTKADSSMFSQSNAVVQTPTQKEKLTNGVNGAASLSQDPSGFSTQPSTSTKRKADEDLVRDDGNVNTGPSKKARSEAEVSYPSLIAATPAKEGSQTSNIFKNILNKTDRGNSAATPKFLTNGTSGNSFLAPGPSDTPALTNTPANLFAAKPAANTTTDSVTFQPGNVSLEESEVQKSPFTFTAANTLTETAKDMKSPSTFKPATTLINAAEVPKSSCNFMPAMSTKAAEAPKSPFTFKSATTSSSSALASKSPFTIKPAADGGVSTDAVKPVTFKPPTFGTGSPVNFMAQFGKSAAENERKEKEKRKADDFDSDEDDEAEWERKYAEEQRAKRQKIVEAAKGKTAVFIPGKGFVFSEGEKSNGVVGEDKPAASVNQDDTSEPAVSAGRGLVGSGTSTPSTTGGASIFDSPNLSGQQKSLSTSNIFGHLSDADSGVDASKTEDADDEETGSESDGEGKDAHQEDGKNSSQERLITDPLDQRSDSEETEDIQSILRKTRSAEVAGKEKTQAAESFLQSTAPGKSLFDRISKDENGNNIRQLPSTEEKKSESALAGASTTTIFGNANPSITSTTQNTTSIFSSSIILAGDHTWKPESPIKFGGPTTAPVLTLTSATPLKGTSGEDKGTPPSPFTGLFGPPKPTIESPAKLSSNIFGSPSAKSADVGFGFGGPPKIAANSLLMPSAPTSGATSRATSPGMTTDTGAESANESTAEGAETESAENAQQVNLTTGGPGEEDEDVLIEVRAKAMMWVPEINDDYAKPGWNNKGLGPLRVLKHRHSGKARIIMRLDPSGRLVLNAALLSGVNYQHQAPSAIKMAVASEDGKLNTWVVRVKTDEDAIKLAKIMEENKSS